jgi:ABC-2 type transport system ATP-binding protein
MVINIQNLSFGYRRQKLFTDLNLQLSPGHIHGLLGKNGVGKTTLLKLISGLRYPQEGACLVWDFVPRKRIPGMLEDLYLIPEEFSVPAISINSYEKIYAPFYPRFDGNALAEYAREFDLDREKKLTELSYGQKKKFLLAFGLATNCRLLLLDEPTNGLDIPSKSQFRRVLAAALTEDRIIIVSTHQVRDMENLIDNIIILEDGKIVFNHDMHEISMHLAFQSDRELPQAADVVYAEKVLGGYMVVRKNVAGEESRIELETLFNAVIAEGDRVSGLFPGGES